MEGDLNTYLYLFIGQMLHISSMHLLLLVLLVSRGILILDVEGQYYYALLYK